MSKKLPYMSSPGTVSKILKKIKDASVPSKFTADYLETVLGFRGGNAKTFISWAKRCGLLGSDGSPTELYKQFRNPVNSGTALASALKVGYQEIFRRNEFANKLNDKDLKGHIIEITGDEPESRVVGCIFQTFKYAKELANFEGSIKPTVESEEPLDQHAQETVSSPGTQPPPQVSSRLGINYTFNLVLPKTDDPKVHAAIFKALRDNLL